LKGIKKDTESFFDTLFEWGDIVWVAGDRKKISEIIKQVK